MSSGARAAPGAIAFFGDMTKVVVRALGVGGGKETEEEQKTTRIPCKEKVRRNYRGNGGEK
jgi:hypothetical protein